MNVGLFSYATALGGFLFLSALLLASLKRGRVGGWLVAASVVTAAWAAVMIYAAIVAKPSVLVVSLSGLAKDAVWIGVLLTVMSFSWLPHRARAAGDLIAPGFVVLLLANAAYDAARAEGLAAPFGLLGAEAGMALRLAFAVVGLLLVENLFRNTVPARRWNIKFLCIGLGGMFAYDLFLYSDALLYRRVDAPLADARGFISALVVPLIAVSAARNPHWSLDVFVSRRAIFHSSTLIGAGIYLIAMAGAGYFLGQFGGDWGPILQAVFLFAAAVLLVLAVFSGQFRAYVRVNLSKHFLTYRYDYREEWLRLIRTISSIGLPGGLPVRIINAVADVVDSPDGVLFLRREGDRFAVGGSWNSSAWQLREMERDLDPAFVQFLEERQWIIDLNEAQAAPERYAPLAVPDWIAALRRAWLIVPLMHHDWLLGFLLLGRPRAPRDLNWEDYDLLKTVGRQAASYLSEHQTAQALADSRQFDQFNKRFAFVLHDVKNLVSQLSMALANAEKYRGNEAFYDDMRTTVKESVDKMNRLLVRLHEGGLAAKATTAVPLADVLRSTVERTACPDRELRFDCRAADLQVVADRDRLQAVIAHLIDNAIDATPAGAGRVAVRLTAFGSDAVIEVEDNGKGMEPAFVRDELFKPFKTTKNGGYGIGAYESREFVHELGGRMDVESELGKGTTVRIRLPAIGVARTGAEAKRRAELQ